MQNPAVNRSGNRKSSIFLTNSTFVMVGLMVVACVATIIVKRFLPISPALIGAVGIPTIVIL